MLSNVVIGLVVLAACGQLASNEEKQKQLAKGSEIPVSAWIRELKSESIKFRPKNAIESADEGPAYFARIRASLDGKVLKVTGTVRSFRWEEGVAHLGVSVAGVEKADKLSVNFPSPISVKMDKETAKTFASGQRFELRAVADFYKGVNPPRDALHLARISSKAYITIDEKTTTPFLGGFTSRFYKLSVAGKEYEGVWAVTAK